MIKGKKRIQFLVFDIDVMIRDDVPENFNEASQGGIYTRKSNKDDSIVLVIWFKDVADMNIMCHECYHLFMRMLELIDDGAYSFNELNSEIYAYEFGMLCQRVLNVVRSFPYYQELLAKLNREDKKRLKKKNTR